MLEPEIAAFVARSNAIYSVGSGSLPAGERRRNYERYAAAFTPALPSGVSIENAAFNAPAGHTIHLRLYRPGENTHSPGMLLYFHGGGFCVGSLDSHQIVTARLAADTGLCVIAVDYRLAPEHRAPAAHDDCLDVTLAALGGRLPFAPLPAALLLSVAMQLRDRGIAGVHGVALVYPMLGVEPQRPACDTEAHAPMLTLADVRTDARLYWADTPLPGWTVPLDAASFNGLPPTLAVGVEHDPLRDDARVFVELIQAAGGQARLSIEPGLVHGCWRALQTSPGVQRMHDTVCRFLLDAVRRRV